MLKSSLPVCLVGLFFVLATLSGCAVNPVTGEQQLMLLSEADEAKMGQGTDKSIVEQYGIYDNSGLQSYLNGIGQTMARVSHRPTLQWQFKVMDSPVVNAFAAPGGYIYVTRGLLAATNNEAELAAVLGHEIGHVTARHSAQQYSNAMLTSIGLGLGQSVMGEYGDMFGRAMEVGAGLLFLKFSRDDERQADALGVEYAARVGYDAARMADFFTTLQRQSAADGEGGARLPEFFSTHPSPVNREATVRTMAANWQAKLPFRQPRVGRKAFLAQVDGLVYGEDPRKGFRDGDWYYLPQYQLKMPIPSGWDFTREGKDFQMTDPQQKAAALLTIYPDAKADEVAAAFVEATGAKLQKNELSFQAGMNVRRLLSVLQDGEQVAVIASNFFQRGADVFGFHGIAEQGDYQALASQLEFPAKGLSLIKDRARLNPTPQRIVVRSVDRSGSVEQVLKRLNVKQELWQKTAWLNGKRLTDGLAAGEQIKVIQ